MQKDCTQWLRDLAAYAFAWTTTCVVFTHTVICSPIWHLLAQILLSTRATLSQTLRSLRCDAANEPQGRSFMAFLGVLAVASLMASIGVIQQSKSVENTLLTSELPSAAPQLHPVIVRDAWNLMLCS